MHHLTHSELTRFTPEQIFALVADVPSYPAFLPWCRAARVLRQESEQVFLAELVIGFKGITERYTSRVSLTPHSEIRAEMVEGPFHHLLNLWHFTQDAEGKTRIELELEFQFKSRILDKMIGGMFERASEKMIAAFRQRAHTLYDSEEE